MAISIGALCGCSNPATNQGAEETRASESELPAPESGTEAVLRVQHGRPSATITPAEQPELSAVPGPIDASGALENTPGVADNALEPASVSESASVGVSVLSPTGQTDSSGQGAVDAIRSYYAAINSHQYSQAYSAWANGGSASGQTPQQFADSYASTASIDVQIMAPGRVEGAAGSRYVEVPVRVTTLQTDGNQRQFGGSYTLRSSAVDGGDPAWRIASASLREIAN